MKTKISKRKKIRRQAMLVGLLLLPFLLRSCGEMDRRLLPLDPGMFWTSQPDTMKSLLLLLLLIIAATGFIFLIGVLARGGGKMGLLMLAAFTAGSLLSSPAVQQKLAPKSVRHADSNESCTVCCDTYCFDGGGMPAAAPAPVVPPPAAPVPGGAAGA